MMTRARKQWALGMALCMCWSFMAGFLWIGIPKASAEETLETVIIGNFESDFLSWSFYNGAEYPGANGSLAQDSSSVHSGTASGKLHADFGNGGAYVSTRRSVPNIDARALTFALQTSDMRYIGLRLTDSTGQVHQQRITVPASADWQTFTVTQFNAGAAYIHFGGANDGVWHGPVKQVEFIMDRGLLYAGKTSGDTRFDDVALLAPPPPLSVSDSRYSNVFLENEAVAFNVSTQADRLEWTVTDFWDRTVASGSPSVSGSPFTLALSDLPKGYFTLTVNAYRDNQLLKQQKKAFAILSSDNPSIEATDSPFGMGTHAGWSAASTKPEFAELLQRAGVKNVRDEVPWSGMEQQRGVYQITQLKDTYLRLLNQKGIHPMIILDYTNPLYDNNGLPYTEDGIQGYANYGNELANRYEELIPNLEVYNEYNSREGGTPSKYYNMLKTTYETIKADHPDTQVVGPAPSYVDILNWMESLYQLGGLSYLDAVTLHPYNFPAPPEGLEQLAETYRSVIRKYNNGNDKPIWFTEDGWPTHTGGTSEQLQASYLVRSYVLALSAGVEKMFWYDFMDDGTNAADAEHRFGIVRNEGDALGSLAPKPSYVTYGVLTRELTGAQYVARDDTTAAVRSYRFQKDGTQIRAMWAVAPKQVKLRTDEPIVLTDMMGNAESMTPFEGYVYVSLTGEPLYVTGNIQSVEESDAFVLSAAKGVVGEPGKATLRVRNPSANPLDALLVMDGAISPVQAGAGGSTDVQVSLTPAATTGVQHVAGWLTVNGKAFGLLQTDVTVEKQLTYRVQPLMVDSDSGDLSIRFLISNHSGTKGLPVRQLHWQLGANSGDLDVNDTVAPGDTKSYDIPLTGYVTRTTYAGSFAIAYGESETASFERKLDFNAIVERTVGSDADAEALPPEDAIDLSTGHVAITGYAGADDASGLVWLNWDRDHLFVTAKITDNAMAAPASGDGIWQNDGIQFGIGQGVPGDSSEWYEMGMAMTPDGPAVYRWLAPYGVPTGSVNDADVHIARDEENRTTTYRLALPWTELPTLNPVRDVVDSFSFVLNDNDGSGRRGYIEWGAGIATAKDAGKFRSFQFLTATDPDVPGQPVLSSNSGHAYGLHDGNYTVSMNMFWGDNGSKFKLFENGALVYATTLTKSSPSAQSAEWKAQGKSNGTYTYVGELSNSAGRTVSQPLVVQVTDAQPGKPVLAHDNWDGDGSYAVSMNLWWGTNATEYRLYENGELIDTQSLTAATPGAQSATTSLAGKPVGVYEYRCELANAAGVTSSEKLSVSVTH